MKVGNRTDPTDPTDPSKISRFSRSKTVARARERDPGEHRQKGKTAKPQ
jgi:hypothetical protein